MKLLSGRGYYSLASFLGLNGGLSRSLFVLGSVFLFATTAFAQDYAKVEVHADYSYMRFNPQNSDIVSGLSLNGGGGGVTVYVNHWLGIQGDFQGYATSGNRTFTFPATANSPCPAGCTVKASGDMFTYNVGPILKYRAEHFEPSWKPRSVEPTPIRTKICSIIFA